MKGQWYREIYDRAGLYISRTFFGDQGWIQVSIGVRAQAPPDWTGNGVIFLSSLFSGVGKIKKRASVVECHVCVALLGAKPCILHLLTTSVSFPARSSSCRPRFLLLVRSCS